MRSGVLVSKIIVDGAHDIGRPKEGYAPLYERTSLLGVFRRVLDSYLRLLTTMIHFLRLITKRHNINRMFVWKGRRSNIKNLSGGFM
jgi:hypothetical protein